MTRIAVVLLNWKGADDTVACIETLTSQTRRPDYQIVVVDNASGDGSPEQIASFCATSGFDFERVNYKSGAATIARLPASETPPIVTLIEADDNLGFCRGNNIGAEYAFGCGADAVLILNNDTTAAPDMIEHLEAAAEALGPRVLISPQILYYDDPETIWWFGGRFSGFLSPSYLYQGETRRSDVEGFPETEWVSGCATLISRELFDEIGLYDPIFFIWCDEWDLSLRARERGISLRIAPASIVYHKVGKSLGIVSPLTFFYAMRNMIYLRYRYLKQPKRALIWLAYLPRKLLQAANLSLRTGDKLYVLAFLDALMDREGGIWKRQ